MSIITDFNKDRIGFSYDMLLALLAFFIPLSSALPNLLLAPIGILLFFKFSKSNIYLKPVLLFVFTLVFLILLAFFKGRFFAEFGFYSRLFISMFLLVSVAHISRLKYVERAFIIGTMLAMLIAVYNIMAFENFKWSFAAFGNTAVVNDLLRIERPYFGFLLAVVVYLCLRHRSWLYYSIAVIASAFCLLIAARLSLGIIVLLWATFFFQLLKPLGKWRIPLVISAVFLCVIAVLSNENIQERFKLQGNLEQSMAKALDFEPRYVIWPCTFTTLQSTTEILFGLRDNQQLEQRLIECYGESIENNPSKKAYFINEKFNPHNQYLHFLCLGGVITLLLFFLAFKNVLWSHAVPFELKILTVMFALFFVFEALLYRQLGCYLFGGFIGLLARRASYFRSVKGSSL